MKSELVEQSVQFTFAGKNYKDGEKTRTMKNIKLDASAEDIVKVGQALSSLQKDDGLTNVTLVQHSDIKLPAGN